MVENSEKARNCKYNDVKFNRSSDSSLQASWLRPYTVLIILLILIIIIEFIVFFVIIKTLDSHVQWPPPSKKYLVDHISLPAQKDLLPMKMTVQRRWQHDRWEIFQLILEPKGGQKGGWNIFLTSGSEQGDQDKSFYHVFTLDNDRSTKEDQGNLQE
ncbi:MAG: hypothetical protein ACYTF1_17055 [Planctomycetota bacterium]|jgi:hypothetical protein